MYDVCVCLSEAPLIGFMCTAASLFSLEGLLNFRARFRSPLMRHQVWEEVSALELSDQI